MAKENRKTTVDLTKPAQEVKNRYVHLGLKNILSAGLLLFGKESADGKLNAIADANEIISPEPQRQTRTSKTSAKNTGSQRKVIIAKRTDRPIRTKY